MLVPQPFNLEGDGPKIQQSRLHDYWSSKDEQNAVRKSYLKILHWNAGRFTYEKASEFRDGRYSDIDVLLIQEATLRDIEVPGFRCCQRLKSGVGIAIYVRPTIEFRKIVLNEKLHQFNLDENFLTAGIQIGDIHVMSIYVHPSTSLCDRKEFVTTLTKFLEHKEKWITSGDLNDWWNMFSDSNENSNSAWSILMENDIVFCLNDGRITRPRSGRALDISFSKGIDRIYWDLMTEDRDFDSDHLETFVCVDEDSVIRHDTSEQINAFRDWARIKKDIGKQLRYRDHNLNGSAVLDWYTEKLNHYCSSDKYISKSKQTYKPWWSKELSDLKRKKNRAFNNGDETLFRSLRKDFRKLIRKSKRIYYRATALEIANSFNPFRGVYSIIPSLKKKFTKKRPIQENGPFYTANKIAKDFEKIASTDEDFREEKAQIEYHLESMVCNVDHPITEREFMSVLENAKKRTSPGSDGLQYNAWSKLCEVPKLRSDILKALNEVLATAEMPTLWKEALIHPLPKEDGSYRPISLLNCLSKVLDKIVARRLDEECPYRMAQFGCQKGLSTHMSISRVLHHSSHASAEDKFFGMLSVDFSKAYDRVDRSILINKMIRRGVSPYLIRYVHRWLYDRSNRVRYNGILSDRYSTDLGIPQGSPISVTLWKLYVDELPVNDSNVSLYMDDIVFWRSESSVEALQESLQEEANVLSHWITLNKLRVNHRKTTFMVNDYEANFPLVFAGTTYYPTKQMKYLGVEMISEESNNYLSLNLRKVGTDMIRRCSLINRVRSVFPVTMIRMFAQAIVMGKLNYYLPFIGAESADSLRPLEVALNHCKRLITGAFCSTPVSLLSAASGIPPLAMLINKAAGSLYVKLRTQDSLLAREYFTWDGVGDKLSPLGNLWRFQEYVEDRTKFWQESEELMIDFQENPEKCYLESLYKCEMQIEDTKKSFFTCYREKKKFFAELAQYDILIWSDGSMKTEVPTGAVGYLWNTNEGEVLGEFGETFTPIFSSFQAETLALKCALQNCFAYDTNVTGNSICVLSDSQALLRHLKKLQLSPSLVSGVVIEILQEIHEAFERNCQSITFKWIPGHSGLGYNPRADKLASEAYETDTDPTTARIPVKTLKHLASRRMNSELALYLDEHVQNSADKMNPPRDAFKSIEFGEEESINGKKDIILFRLRSGHNRSNHHLARLKMVKTPNCRYCNFEEEDGYHLVMNCTKIPDAEKFEELRGQAGVFSREDWNQWLFSKRDRSLRRKMMDLVLNAKIEI